MERLVVRQRVAARELRWRMLRGTGSLSPLLTATLLGALAALGACSSPSTTERDGVDDATDAPVFPDLALDAEDPDVGEAGDVADAADDTGDADAAGDPDAGRPVPIQYRVEVVAEYPHDPEAFTQGLVFSNGTLYEGTGLYGESSVREVVLETGEVVRQLDLAPRYFGEGLTVVGDRLVQLTWQDRVGFVYDLDTFELIDEFAYDTEGWGLTYDGARLIMSDGTATLRFLDPTTFEVVGQVVVVDSRGPVRSLNELEFIDGHVWANIWFAERIVIVDPETGWVVGEVDASGLLAPGERPADMNGVLNGIAWDEADARLVVTGKLWPKLFEIELVRR
jgi:glutaminyl-peptide cyclotransferase